ncbi:hypothetical protein I204_03106 [Kwoniella mangroviensis CBS 8886]|nr:hypothetical protein I204_03106 [Kwoniella mangroviensis CBS 8886]
MRGLPTNEKSLLPSSTPQTEDDILKPKPGWLSRNGKSLGLFFGLFLILQHIITSHDVVGDIFDQTSAARGERKSSCQQADAIYPKAYNVSSLVVNQKDRVINWLAGAVRVPTETFDDFGKVGEDDRWDKFHKFHEYLEKSFPLVHKHLKRTPVYTHAVLFEWEGTDPSLKPLLLNTVPILPTTRNLWKHDPFSGYYDGEYIWGRGSSDDKSGLIGALTVLLAFGNDEEIAGNGALALSHLIEEKYGKDSIAILIDEGNGVDEAWGQLFAAPAVGEKGSTNIQIKVETQGGHSSVPPSHTGIGYISLLIAALEAHPFKPDLQIDSPLVNYITCAADAAPGIPKDLKKNALRLANSVDSKKGKFDRKALKAIEDWWVTGSYEDGTLPQGKGRALVSTTQAVDIINGGLKVNALPESVSAVVNHRINIASSVAKLKEHIEAVLAPAATKLNLSIEAFGKKVNLLEGPKAGKVIVDTTKFGLDPAPLSPFTLDDPAWRVFTGTAKGVYATRPEAYINEDEAKKEIFTVPALSTGNQHLNNAHTVNEAISADVFVEQVRWFLNFIVNVDEATDL